MTPDEQARAREAAIEVLLALRRIPMDVDGFFAGEKLGETECVKVSMPLILDAFTLIRHAAQQEERTRIEWCVVRDENVSIEATASLLKSIRGQTPGGAA